MTDDGIRASNVEWAARALRGNLENGRDKLASKNQLFVRERLALLFDQGSFVEDGLLANMLATDLPADKRFNPLSMNPYMLSKALPQVGNYSLAELVRAMELLLECNRRLIFSSLDAHLVLQQTLVQIVGTNTRVRPPLDATPLNRDNSTVE